MAGMTGLAELDENGSIDGIEVLGHQSGQLAFPSSGEEPGLDQPPEIRAGTRIDQAHLLRRSQEPHPRRLRPSELLEFLPGLVGLNFALPIGQVQRGTKVLPKTVGAGSSRSDLIRGFGRQTFLAPASDG